MTRSHVHCFGSSTRSHCLSFSSGGNTFASEPSKRANTPMSIAIIAAEIALPSTGMAPVCHKYTARPPQKSSKVKYHQYAPITNANTGIVGYPLTFQVEYVHAAAESARKEDAA